MTVGGSGKDVIPNSKAFSLEETSAERLVDGICDGGQDPLMSSSSASAASPLASMAMSKVMAPCRCTQPPATAMAITTSDHMRRISKRSHAERPGLLGGCPLPMSSFHLAQLSKNESTRGHPALSGAEAVHAGLRL